MRFWWAGSGSGGRPQIVATAQRVPAPQNDLRVLSILGITDPAGHAHVLSEVAAHTPPDACDPETAHAVGTALHVTGALELSTTFLAVAVTGLRRQGGLWLLAQALAQLARNTVSTGNLKIASTVAEEAVSLARQTRQPLWEATAQTAQAMVASVRGENELAESLLSEAASLELPQTASAALSDIQWARALAALSDGRHDEAFEHLQRTFDPHDPTHHDFRSAWCMGSTQAALRSGHIDKAREQLTTSEDLAQSSSPRLVVGLTLRGPVRRRRRRRSPLSGRAGREFEPLAAVPGGLLLEYGTWLRRHRKIAQARMPLRSALDTFVALGAVPWAERARQELRAARETRRCQPEARAELTDQEKQIAHLAAQVCPIANRSASLHLAPDGRRSSLPYLPQAGSRLPRPAAGGRREPNTDNLGVVKVTPALSVISTRPVIPHVRFVPKVLSHSQSFYRCTRARAGA